MKNLKDRRRDRVDRVRSKENNSPGRMYADCKSARIHAEDAYARGGVWRIATLKYVTIMLPVFGIFLGVSWYLMQGVPGSFTDSALVFERMTLMWGAVLLTGSTVLLAAMIIGCSQIIRWEAVGNKHEASVTRQQYDGVSV